MSQLEIPQEFKDQIGKEVVYMLGKHKKCQGIVQDVRFSSSQYMNMKTRERFYGIEFKIKPNDGLNNKRAIWTKAFSSGIKIEEEER